MALVLADRVQDVTTTTGTGTITLANTPPTGFQSFAAIGNGNTTYYTIYGGNDWEVGIGTYTAVGTTLTRDTVLSSSNSGNLVNFGAGEKTVFVTYPAEKSVNYDAAGNVNINITGNAATATRATNLYDGTAGAIPYQTAANTTTFLSSASGVLVGGNPPQFSTTPTLTGTNFSAIPNSALSNNSVTIGSTVVSLGATATTLAGLTSVTLTQDPTTALEVATKQYVDTLAASGITYHEPVKYEAPTALNATYNNGTAGVGATLTNAGTLAAFAPDGFVTSVGDRILVYNQAAPAQNGVYTVTTVGSGSVAWVLTRATDANSYGIANPNKLGQGSAFFVTNGNTGAGETYICNTAGTITFGTTAITFAQISDVTVYSAGTGLTLSGTEFSLTTPVATTLGGTGLTTFGAANRAIYSSGTTTLTAGTLPTAAGGTGHTTYTDGQVLIGRSSDGSLEKATLTAGTGISITNGSGAITITNSSPNQVVSITGGGTTTVGGSYPNFSISSADQYVGTVTSVSASANTTGTDVAVSVADSTTTPAITISIPTASASARGALSSTDWSTFNAKQTALVSGTNIKTINGSSILGSGNLSTLTSPLAVVGNSTAGAEIRLPEDTDNGSNYVALKAPDSLAADLTFTLPTADGTSGQVLQTNGSGQLSFATASSGTQTFTSSGSITAGQAVSINSNGTVSATTGVNQSATFNTDYYWASGVYASLGSYYDTTTGWHFAGLGLNSDYYLMSYKVSSAGAITNVNTVYVGSGSSSTYKRGIIFRDTTANRIIYILGGAGPTTMQINAFSVNTITGAMTVAGGTAPFDTSYNAGGFDAYFDSYANRTVIIKYSGSGTANVYAYQYVTNIGFNQTAATSFTVNNSNTGAFAAAFNSNTNSGMVFYSSSSTAYTANRTVTLNAAGNSITLGSELVLTNGYGFYNFAHAAYFPSIDRYILQHATSTGYCSTMLLNASGAYVALTSTVPTSNLYYNWANYGFSNSYDTVNNVVYNAGANYSNTAIYTWSYTLTANSTPTYVNGSSLLGSSLSYGTSYTYDPTLSRAAIVVYQSSTGYQYVVGYLPAVFSTTADKFVGFSTQTVSTGQSVTVTVLGGTNTSQSGLTTGSNYYLQLNGSISTTPSAYGIVAKALSATSAQVTTGGAFKKLISQTVISGSPASITITLPSGFSQFELTFQYVRGTTATPNITATTSDGSSVNFYGRGWYIYAGSSYNQVTQSSASLYLTGNLSHGTGSPFGGSLLLQSSSNASYWNYQMMTSFYNSGDSYFSGTGYSDNTPTSLTISGFGTFNGGVITLYGIG